MGDEAGLEALARGLSAGHTAWVGSGGGLRTETGATWERAAYRAAGVPPLDLALLEVSLGVGEALALAQAQGALMARVELIQREEGQQWPRAWKGALVGLALEELALGPGRGLRDEERRGRFAATARGLTRSAWRWRWGLRYERLIGWAWGRVGRARDLYRG